MSGLSSRVDALSFEFVTMQRDRAQACLDRCVSLGFRQFDLSVGETLHLGEWRSAEELQNELRILGADANSGDIYAR